MAVYYYNRVYVDSVAKFEVSSGSGDDWLL